MTMSIPGDYYQQIRKLRKKLRQIEHLERLERDLSDEELLKVARKDTVRSQLLELLSEFSETDDAIATGSREIQRDEESNTSISTDFSTSVSEADVKVVFQTNEEGQITPDTLSKEETTVSSQRSKKDDKSDKSAKHSQKNDQTPMDLSRSGQSQKVKENKPSDPVLEPSPKKAKKSVEKKHQEGSALCQKWRNSLFQVTSLDSHSDLITAVYCHDNILLSASRDTTVKVWDLRTLKEIRNLGGHTGTVTDVLLLPQQHIVQMGQRLGLSVDDGIILSASMDCSFKVWSSSTGELLRSVYTYNPITKMRYLHQLSLVVTASDGGKLELWDIETKQNVFSILAHESAVTGLCVDEHYVYTSSADGEIRVHEIRDSTLVCVFVSENLKTERGNTIAVRHVKSLGTSGDKLLYGDDGVNIKVVSWRKGQVRKVPNHREDFGMTDAIFCDTDLIVTSAYDLDTGMGYVNVFEGKEDIKYITSLADGETGRIICVCGTRSSNDSYTVVTGGTELKVWRQYPNTIKRTTDVVAPYFMNKLTEPAVDSDLESDVEFSESEEDGDEAGARFGGRRGSDQSKDRGWLSWCTVL